MKVFKVLSIWLLIPLALGLVGFYVLGPRLGQTKFMAGALAVDDLPTEAKGVSKGPEPFIDDPDSGKKRHPKEPDVEVKVNPISRRRIERDKMDEKRSKRRESSSKARKKQPSKKPAKPRETDDEAGSGGGAGAPPPSTSDG